MRIYILERWQMALKVGDAKVLDVLNIVINLIYIISFMWEKLDTMSLFIAVVRLLSNCILFVPYLSNAVDEKNDKKEKSTKWFNTFD